MFSFKPIYFVVFALVFRKINADISDKRLCIDANCSELISVGKTLLRYNSIEKYRLSFSPNEDVKVFSYGAGNRADLIGVEIKGKRGYVNKEHIKETNLVKKPGLLVNTEKSEDKPEVPLGSVGSEINANPTQQPYEIVDGTKILLEAEVITTEAPPLLESSTATLPLQAAPNHKETLTSVTVEKNLGNDLPDEKDDLLSELYDDEDLVVNIIKETDNEKPLERSSQEVPVIENNDFSFNVNEESSNSDVPKAAEDIVSEKNPETVEPSQNVINVLANQLSNEVVENKSSSNELEKTSFNDTIENKVVEIISEVQTDSSENKANDVTGETKPNLNIFNDTDVSKSENNKVDEIKEVSPISEESKISVEDTTPLPYENIDTIQELVTVTDFPLELETPLPSETETVTPNPFENPVKEINKIDSNFEPEFKDEEDSSVNKDKEVDIKTGGVLSLFSKETSVDNTDPQLLDVADELSNRSLEEELPLVTESVNEVSDSTSTEEIKATEIVGELPQVRDLQSDMKINKEDNNSDGIASKVMSFLNLGTEDEINDPVEEVNKKIYATSAEETIIPHEESKDVIVKEKEQYCDSQDSRCPKYVNSIFTQQNCPRFEEKLTNPLNISDAIVDVISSDLFLYLTTTALSVIILIFGSIIFDKCRREGPLIARINKLEQQLLTSVKENNMLQEKIVQSDDQKSQLIVDSVPNEVVEELNRKLAEMTNAKQSLEEQIQALEKELDNSTEVGIELNKIISEMLSSSDGSEILKENVEQMQKKLLEQQDIISSANETLNVTETENHELKLELDISNKKVIDLQAEVDKMIAEVFKIEEEKYHQNSVLEKEISFIQSKYKEAQEKEFNLTKELQNLRQKLVEVERVAEIKVKEYETLKTTLNDLKSIKNNKDALSALLEVTEVKAQLEQLKSENFKFSEQLNSEREANNTYTTKMQSLLQEMAELKEKYEKADKEKVETKTKLEVLNTYFKEKEEQMLKDISKYESLWAAKEGEATSTTERIKYMQDELQNYKAQNEGLKHEIVNQEVELKSQISMLEKKAHENWVTNRQTERKLEEARQEAAQLRNRLTLRERALVDGNNQMRMQSPLHQNGEIPVSPLPLDPTQSPPPLFNPRDHLTKSPPMSGMPFLPPPLGASPFIPPPPLNNMMPPFMPPLPPGLFPADHRPPPLGRMSSPPPVGDRYTPESTVYSEYDRYDRRSPSPVYDSEYGASPPSLRAYSPYDSRRDYNRPQARSNGRNSKGLHSSGSENDSLGKSNKKSHRKV